MTGITAGNISGNVANANYAAFAGNITTAAQPNITSVGTLTSLSVTGNISAGNVSATTFTGALSGAATTAGTVTTAAQPNITSVGTLTGLGVNGTITGVNITANTGVFTGNGSGLSAIAGGNVTGTVANATFATTAGSATTAGTVTTNAQSNITSVGTLTSLSVTGNITSGNANLGNAVSANFFIGDGSLLTGITAGNISGNVANANYAAFAGVVITAAQPNITSVGTLTSLGVNGTVTAVAFTANTGVFTGNGSGLSAIAGGNVTGQVGNALVASTVYTNAQPNITSVGSLTGLTVSNATGVVNFSNTANVTLGNVSNLRISGGSADFILQTDGSSNLSWVAKPSSGATITDDTSTNATYYPIYATASSGTLSTAGIATTKLQFNPSTGEMTATNFNSLSDEKFKTNIKPIINALEIILKLEGVSYDWVEGGSSHGLIAQAVEKIVSNVVSSNDERKTVNYSAIIPFLIEAIKTQQKTIDSHSQEINALKNQVEQILNKIQGI